MSRIDNILNNTMDIIISSVRLGIGYMSDKIKEVKEVNKVMNDKDSWNGGETFKRLDEDERVKTPMDDEYPNGIYDGIMDRYDD